MKNLPFNQPGRLYKGNLHTHSTLSDGKWAAADVVAQYRRAGYDFVALSEHFLEKHDFPIADTRPYRKNDFTTLIAAELHVPEISTGEEWHILAVGLPLDFAPPHDGESGPEIARRAADSGAFIGIVHPSWYGLTIEDANSISCAHAVEIYNHGADIELDRGTDWGFLDILLNEGRRLGGFATDDAHYMTYDCFGGWVHVLATELDPDEILQSLKAGRYYSSQGPEIHDVRVGDGHVDIVCSPAASISAVGHGARSVYRVVDGMTECRLPLSRFKGGYFRITVRDDKGRKAWTNPVWPD